MGDKKLYGENWFQSAREEGELVEEKSIGVQGASIGRIEVP
jgi:hypothetical protein